MSEPLTWQNSTLLAQPVEQAVTEGKERREEVHVIDSLNLLARAGNSRDRSGAQLPPGGITVVAKTPV